MSAESCPACGAPLTLVWVHGHGQCANCGVNVVPCCMGAGQEADELAGLANGAPTVDEVIAACTELAGPGRLLTGSALLMELAARHGCTWDVAEAAVERAVSLRRLHRQGDMLRVA